MMDSVMVQAIQQNTVAVNHLSGVLLTFMGVFIAMIVGYLVTRYTLRG